MRTKIRKSPHSEVINRFIYLIFDIISGVLLVLQAVSLSPNVESTWKVSERVVYDLERGEWSR